MRSLTNAYANQIVTCPRCGHPEYSADAGCAVCHYRAPTSPNRPSLPESHGGWGDGATRIESDPPTFGPTPLSGLNSASSTAGVLGPGQQFGTRYQVLKVLGQGGMGVVYRAWDEELGVAVALKVIRPEMMGTPGAAAEIERRFKQELILARQVTHKHVVRIHDLGDVNGIKYITMPFLEGEDLHTTVAAAGKLPVRRALNIARQVASGLEAAHAVGVIHRDLKPANVMIDADDQAVILDFGIARSTSASTMTSGAVVGTLQYMAPEQAEGRSVDQRADIYALGLVLYDMLAGTRRLAATESAISDLMARLKAAPRPIREVEPLVPDALNHIISRCLEPDAGQRFQTTTELLTALDALDAEGHVRAPVISTDGVSRRSIVVAAIVAIPLLGSLTLWIARRPAPAAAVARDPVSVLIADFDNRTGDEIFDGSLEQALGLGVEGSSFVTAFSRREARRAADQIKPGARIDEGIARLGAGPGEPGPR